MVSIEPRSGSGLTGYSGMLGTNTGSRQRAPAEACAGPIPR